MKTTNLFVVICVLSLNTLFAQENMKNDPNFPHLEGPYLGQKTPSLIPETFAPSIVSTEHHEWGGFFTPDMKEFYWY